VVPLKTGVGANAFSRAQGLARIVVAVPVSSPQTCDEFRAVVDDIVCAVTPEPFRGVGQRPGVVRLVSKL
jgi:predicted phosphoribosyltransferase